ncbi:MAG: hypothetical protein K2I96_12805 [Lachnospiraceae bacterium]|nr:hypothetical protein [Lachnospiraceae bacterium]
MIDEEPHGVYMKMYVTCGSFFMYTSPGGKLSAGADGCPARGGGEEHSPAWFEY